MMTKENKSLWLAGGLWCLCLLLTGCAGDVLPDAAPAGGQMSFTAVTEDYGGGTRTTSANNTFENDDVIYVGKTTSQDPQTPVAYTYNGTNFTGGQIWKYTTESVYAFMRGDGGGTLTSDFTIPADQTTAAKLQSADFLYSPEKVVKYADSSTASLNNFTHMVAKVVVNVSLSGGTIDESKLTACVMGGDVMKTVATVSDVGVLTAGSTTGTISMLKTSGSAQFTCFAIPQTIAQNTANFLLITYDGKTYRYPLPNNITFTAGQTTTLSPTIVQAGSGYVIKKLADVTTAEVGYVVFDDGDVFESVAVATSVFGKTASKAVGMIGYVGAYRGTAPTNVGGTAGAAFSCTHGILVALQDAGTDNTRVKNTVPTNNPKTSGQAGYWDARDVTALTQGTLTALGSWQTVTDADWKKIMVACSNAYISRGLTGVTVTADSDTPVGFWALMRAAGGICPGDEGSLSDNHWTNYSVSYPPQGTGTYSWPYFSGSEWATASDNYINNLGNITWYTGRAGWSFAVRAVRAF